jgi:carbon monoxide dehydrogenase subunit G
MYMPSGTHQVEIQLPINDIWDFIKDMDNWAPLVPGYITHSKINNHQSYWNFQSESGLIKKKVSLIIDITEWKEPNKVSFQLSSKKYSGCGYFQALPLYENKTKMTGYLEISAEGTMGSVKNAVLKTVLPKKTEELAVAISLRLEELKGSRG